VRLTDAHTVVQASMPEVTRYALLIRQLIGNVL